MSRSGYSVKALDESEVASVRARFTGPRCAERFDGDDDDPDAGRCDLSAGHDGLHCWGTLSRDEIARLLTTLDETRVQLAAVQEGFALANVRAAKAESDLAEARALLTTGAQALLASERELAAALARAERADGARARLEAAERVVEAARPLLRAYWDDQIADYDDAVGRLIDSVAALDALPAAAPARAGDDS